jgi:hypothetical protein
LLAAAVRFPEYGDSGDFASRYDGGPAGGRVPRVPRAQGFFHSRSQGWVCAGQQVSGSAQMRCQALVIASVQGQFAANFQRCRRLVKVSVPETRRLLRLATTPMTAVARQLGYAWSRWRQNTKPAPATTTTRPGSGRHSHDQPTDNKPEL